jgi:translation initiation factor IF-2
MSKPINSHWLKLKNPKILSLTKSKDSTTIASTSTISPIKQLEPILKDSKENSLLQRIEKKNKYQSKTVDPLDPQKNKGKLKKKIRAKIYIGEEEDNINSNFTDSSTMRDNKNLQLSLIRPGKPLKKKILTYRTSINFDVKIKKDTINKKNINKQSAHLTQSITDRKISLNCSLSIQELSSILSVPEADIIKWLFLQGISVTINQIIDTSIAQLIAEHYGFIIEEKNENHSSSKVEQFKYNLSDNTNELLRSRAPIVVILGHVDHGKTTLLDTICKTNNVGFEAGGITQTIVSHDIEIEYKAKKKRIVFLDTPGHEAFSNMRLRCVQITDICILVVAADDSLRPQSIEVINYVQRSNLPLIVAINKIDKSNSNIPKVKEDLMKYNIISEELGGTNSILELSALKNINIDHLLSKIISLAESQELKANVQNNAVGSVLDSYLDKTKGPVATILIKNGLLKVGNFIVVGHSISKIRAIIDSKQFKLESVGPSSVVQIWGLSNLPVSGSIFEAVVDEKQAKKILTHLNNSGNLIQYNSRNLNNRIRLDALKKDKNNLLDKQINLILKTDTHGSIDAIVQAFSKIPQKKVQLNILSITVGTITESDLQLAIISKSIVISFNIVPNNNIKISAEKVKILIHHFNIIYNLINYIQEQMLQLVPLEYEENTIGLAIVETVFIVSKGHVAGCVVKSGRLKSNAYIRVKRNQMVMYNGKLSSLKKVKEDVEEVRSGSECGILIFNFSQWQNKDEVESYELIPKEKTLD